MIGVVIIALAAIIVVVLLVFMLAKFCLRKVSYAQKAWAYLKKELKYSIMLRYWLQSNLRITNYVVYVLSLGGWKEGGEIMISVASCLVVVLLFAFPIFSCCFLKKW